MFPNHQYVNLEDPDVLFRVKHDPRGFLASGNRLFFFDEAQEYPALFSYLLGVIDEQRTKGQFILSGSQNFMLLDAVSQSLAGRVAVLELLPLSL